LVLVRIGDVLNSIAVRLLALVNLRWLGSRRVLAYSRILAFASAVSVCFIFREAMGPIGSDFLAFWSAGRMAVAGHAAGVYDPQMLAAVQAQVGRVDVFPFVNPPPLLLAVWPFGWLEYPAAWIAWVGISYAIWLTTTRKLYPSLAWPIAAFPGALVAAWHAQTGFLTSAIQAGAANWLRDKPLRAGFCIGALIVKPHLAVLIPVALVAGRHWRAVGGAVAAMLGLLALAWLAFGTSTMLAYRQSWAVSENLLHTGDAAFFLRQSTVYAMVWVVASAPAAAYVQTACTLGAGIVTWRCWARQGPLESKLALLFAATPLATPYLFNYDLPFMIVPICWLVVHWQTGFAWRKPILLALYFAPLVTRAMALPLGINPMPLVAAAMVWMIWGELHSGADALPKGDVHSL
jgi:hypothetical protein